MIISSFCYIAGQETGRENRRVRPSEPTTQAEDGLGLDVQKAALRAWAKENGHKLVGTLSDEGISGAKELEDRPGLAEALGVIGEGKANGVVVPRLDRLARDLIVQETVLAEIRRIGGEVFSPAPRRPAT